VLLLDTHAFVWLVTSSPKLGALGSVRTVDPRK